MELLLAMMVIVIAFAAAFVDVMVGGGGLIMVPALAALGMPILTVIGTNRLYVVAFSLTGMLNYLRKKVRLNLKLVAGFAILRVAGSAAGSVFVLSIPSDAVRGMVVFLMIGAIATIFFLRSKKKLAHSKPEKITYVIAGLAILVVGLYEGVVGGGGGTITRVVLTLLLGFAMLDAALADLAMSILSSLASSIIFILNGVVDYQLLLPMLAGGIMGAFSGSHVAVEKGNAWVQNLLYVAVVALLVKLLLFHG